MYPLPCSGRAERLRWLSPGSGTCPAAPAEEGARPARSSAPLPESLGTPLPPLGADRGWAPATPVRGGPPAAPSHPSPSLPPARPRTGGAARCGAPAPPPRRLRRWPSPPAIAAERRPAGGRREGGSGRGCAVRPAGGSSRPAVPARVAGGSEGRGERLWLSPGAAGNLLGSCGAPAFPAEGAPPPMRRGPRCSQPSRPRERLVAGRPDGTPARSGEARPGRVGAPGGRWAPCRGAGRGQCPERRRSVVAEPEAALRGCSAPGVRSELRPAGSPLPRLRERVLLRSAPRNSCAACFGSVSSHFKAALLARSVSRSCIQRQRKELLRFASVSHQKPWLHVA